MPPNPRARLRQKLRLPSARQVDDFDAVELRKYLKKAATKGVKHEDLWISLLSRATMLKPQLKPSHIAWILNTYGKQSHKFGNLFSTVRPKHMAGAAAPGHCLRELLEEGVRRAGDFTLPDAVHFLNAVLKLPIGYLDSCG